MAQNYNDNSTWEKYTLDKLGSYINGRAFKKHEWKKDGLPIIRIQNLNDTTANFNYTDKVHEPRYKVENDDLLVSWAASLGVYLWDRGDAWLNQHIFKVIPNEKLVTKDFLYFLLKSVLSELYLKTHGTGMVHITKGDFDSHEVYIPALPEQDVIVKKLKTALPLVNKSHSNIVFAKAKLNTFRQVVLYTAVTGKLTEEWRNINEKEDWKMLPAEKVCGFITKGTTPKNLSKQSVGNIPYLKVYNIRNNKIDFEYNPSYVDKNTHDGLLKRSKVYPNDVLMNIVGPPLYKVAMVPNSYPEWNVNQAIAIFRALSIILPRYLEIVLSCELYTSQSLSLTRGVVGQSNISLQQCRDIPIPLPTIDEQKVIIKKINLYLGIADEVEKQIVEAEKSVGKLTQAILAKTFRAE